MKLFDLVMSFEVPPGEYYLEQTKYGFVLQRKKTFVRTIFHKELFVTKEVLSGKEPAGMRLTLKSAEDLFSFLKKQGEVKCVWGK